MVELNAMYNSIIFNQHMYSRIPALKPLAYLKNYANISSHRSQLALQFFNRHHKRARLLSMDIIVSI